MRIAFVYDAVYPWVTGGVERRTWEFGRRLADDHDVHWYGLHYWDGPSVVEREGVTLHGVAPPRSLYVDGRRSIPEAVAFAVRLVRPLLSAGFDIVDCQEFPYFPAFPSRAATARHGGTMVLTWHEVWDDYWYEYLGRPGALGRLVERVVVRLPAAHVAVSERTASDVRGLGVEDVELVPNGISTETVAGVDPADRDVDVLFVGRLIREKGVELLVEAAERLPDRRFLVVGDGPERDGLAGTVADAELDDRVTFLEFRESHSGVLALMKAANVFVLPSRREGFGMTALEALACGTPVVTTDHPRNAATALVEDGRTGRVCAPTAGALATAIRTAGACNRAACIQAAAAYDWDPLTDRLERVYREVAP